ncbi:MAG: hypothetical protein VKJ06_07380 [Vampirovibrionales bacterium]|nr:hypothetical protein [Vampirovibrionales bacterium]
MQFFKARTRLGWLKRLIYSPLLAILLTSTLNHTLAAEIMTGVITYDEAEQQERGTVAWYNWYMEARAYIASHGGLACAPGTPIVFSKSGQIRALSEDEACLASVAFKQFAIPAESQLPAIILPVRSHKLPPAAPDELSRLLGSHQP